MSGSKVRVNTLKFAFPQSAAEPSEAEMFGFCRLLQLESEKVYSIHKDKIAKAIFVKFNCVQDMRETQQKIGIEVSFKYLNGTVTNVAVLEAENSYKYVRIFNLPPEIEDREIGQALNEYGIIRQHIREKYHVDTGFPVYSTVRGVYMEVQKEIPAQIRIRNFQGRLYYDGLINKCFICRSTAHMKADCPRKAPQQSQPSVQRRLYSDIIAARAPLPHLVNRELMEAAQTTTTVVHAETHHEEERNGRSTKELEVGVVVSQSECPSLGVGKENELNAAAITETNEIGKKTTRGRNKKRRAEGGSSNESGSLSPIVIPEFPSFLEAQARRTRSKSKQRKYDLRIRSTTDQLGSVEDLGNIFGND